MGIADWDDYKLVVVVARRWEPCVIDLMAFDNAHQREGNIAGAEKGKIP